MNENLEKFRELLTINPELKERIAAEKNAWKKAAQRPVKKPCLPPPALYPVST